MNSASYKKGLETLRGLLAKPPTSTEVFSEMVNARDSVVAQFQPLFSIESAGNLDAEQFKRFLLYDNNRHWSGLHRQGSRICADMKKLRTALLNLLDESEPIAARWDTVIGKVPGMGKAIMSAILLIAHPDRYGVWNNTSEAGLRALGLWPEFGHGTSSGEKYAAVNALLNQLAKDLNTDLWTLDSLFWRVKQADGEGAAGGGTIAITSPSDAAQSFALERHLHDFLFENWDRTELGKEWALYAEDNDPETAYEFPTDVGKIDLLAKHRTQPRWLVIELKRNQTSDDTVGQILRYTAWIRKHLAKAKEPVEGLIIARTVDDNLRYAASEIPHVRLMEYQVSFHLHAAKPLDGDAVKRQPALCRTGGR
ncbi:MAG: hypothetical protein BWX84_00078 [Verrucomicrobia bacterium ADurb.Bin118]|jgi:hypothetical protein|nr:MAG: hypothetical protein BWX84_00078 [Verrucomicrobia bacterium ADurb.Bin118]